MWGHDEVEHTKPGFFCAHFARSSEAIDADNDQEALSYLGL